MTQICHYFPPLLKEYAGKVPSNCLAMTVLSQIFYIYIFQTSLDGVRIRHNVRVKQKTEVKKK